MTMTRKATVEDVSVFLASIPLKDSPLKEFLLFKEITIDMLPFLHFALLDLLEHHPEAKKSPEALIKAADVAIQSIHYVKQLKAPRDERTNNQDAQIFSIAQSNYSEGCETIHKLRTLEEKKLHPVNKTAVRLTYDQLLRLWRLKVEQIAAAPSTQTMFSSYRASQIQLRTVVDLIYGIFMIRSNYSAEKKSVYPTKAAGLNTIENKLVEILYKHDVISDKDCLYRELYLDLLELRNRNYRMFFSGNKLYKQINIVLKQFQQNNKEVGWASLRLHTK